MKKNLLALGVVSVLMCGCASVQNPSTGQLFEAVKNNDYNAVKQLVDGDADIDAVGSNYNTPLLESTRNNNTEISKLLICSGADVNIADHLAATPYYYADKHSNEEIRLMLVAKDPMIYCDTKKEPAVKDEAPKDSDNDGVIDANDKCPNTPPGVLVDADGCTKIFNIKVNFDTDKSDIKPEFQGEVDKAIQIMDDYKGYNSTISGHTDSTASDDYNQALSERRAKAVKDAMVSKGIDSDRVSTVGYGESQPIADNATLEGRYENRRIEMTLQK